MHILEIPSFFPPCGGLFCLDQAMALYALGHEVRILSNVQLGVTINKKEYITLSAGRFEHVMDGITVYQSYQRGLPRMVRYNVNRWVHIVCSMFDDYVQKYGKPDVLHAHCAKWAGYAAMKIGEQYHIPYVITEHLPLMLLEEEFGKAPSSAWQIPLLKQAYEKAQMVLPVSEELVADTACFYGKDYRWQAVSNTIDTEFFRYQERAPREGRMFRFCCVADYSYRKGYDILLPAFQKLYEQCLDVELHVAGKNTDCAKLPVNAKAYGKLDKAGVRQLLYDCDALVLASRSEVQPLVLLEAMATGMPVVATECVPRCLRVGEGCTIVPIDDVEALVRAMKQVMTKPQPNGQLLSRQVCEMASPKVVGQKLSSLFSEIVASR